MLPSNDATARPFVHRTRHTRALHFSIHEVQSFMRSDAPDALALSYTRLMMAFLLFMPQPARIAMVGLGGGSLVKFCHRHLPASHLQVIEISPEVIALRDEFEVPPDDERLSVTLGDGAAWLRDASQACDVLLVDGYDYDGLPSALATQRFYDDCRAALRPGGLLLCNLFREHPQHEVHLDRLRRSFGEAAVLEAVDGDGGANSLVMAGLDDVLATPLPPLLAGPPGMSDEAWASLQPELESVRAAQGSLRQQSSLPRQRRRA